MSETKAPYANMDRTPVRALDDDRQIAQLRELLADVVQAWVSADQSLMGETATSDAAEKIWRGKREQTVKEWKERFNAIVSGDVDSRAVGREREDG